MNDQLHELNVAELLARYLQRQTEAAGEGLGFADVGDATPYDTTPVQPIDPRLAFQDAQAARQYLSSSAGTLPVPPGWPVLVAQQEPAMAIAFCLGNFPQLVRDLQPLLTAEWDLLRKQVELGWKLGRPVEVPGLLEWAESVKSDAERVFAAGALRLARQFDQASKLLAEVKTQGWLALRDNEVAALHWHWGQPERALQMWSKMPSSPVVLFNRGMASLFMGEHGAAVESLSAAVAALPERSAWHHLASLYLTLARG